jgi:hypothetical protein
MVHNVNTRRFPIYRGQTQHCNEHDIKEYLHEAIEEVKKSRKIKSDG